MTATLEVRDLRKQFAIGRPAIDGVSFGVPAGEIVVLLGPSGCGKTTTLRCVAGLEHPTSGRIVIGGTMYTDPQAGVLVPPRRRNVGMVFQSYAVWPHMTVRQNVAYPLRRRGLSRAELDGQVAEARAPRPPPPADAPAPRGAAKQSRRQSAPAAARRPPTDHQAHRRHRAL